MKKLFIYTLTFCITKPVDKNIKHDNFDSTGPTPIQSSSRNVNYKNDASKPLWNVMSWNQKPRGKKTNVISDFLIFF